MEFTFDEKAERLRKEIRRFVKDELPPDHIGLLFADEAFDDHWQLSLETAKKLAKKGWLTISWPKEYGGMGATFWEQAVFKEEEGYWGIPGCGMGIGGTTWVGPTLMLVGTEKQKKKFLPPIAAGDPDGVWCTGYSEPNAGSDLAGLQTRAERHGDEYVINGQKVWTSAAHRARWIWIACRTNPRAEKKHQGLSIILVDMKSPGVSVTPIPNIVGHHVFNEVFFNDVRVPAENRVGEENKGWSVLMTALAFERNFGLVFGGTLQRILDELVVYARSEGLMARESIRRRLAELAMDVRGVRLGGYQTAYLQSLGQDVIWEPSRDKVESIRISEKISRFGMEMMGPQAQVSPGHETGPHQRILSALKFMYWNTPGMRSAGGTTETMRNIIAQFGLQVQKTY
ncbi:MAG: acyl-CoA dehydrogenase family protein [Deltaproteobacteria bacterium]|nr:acyl-CoA dehydrogenase family protein [Deltaproteobacteria bacterium]